MRFGLPVCVTLQYMHSFSVSIAFIHKADGCLTTRCREVSKPRDSGLDFSNRSEIWQAPRQQRYRDVCQISLSDTIIITSNLAASRLHESLRPINHTYLIISTQYYITIIYIVANNIIHLLGFWWLNLPYLQRRKIPMIFPVHGRTWFAKSIKDNHFHNSWMSYDIPLFSLAINCVLAITTEL